MTVTHTETSALREHPDFLAPNFFFSASIKGLAAPLFVRKHVRFGNEIREKKIEGKEVIGSIILFLLNCLCTSVGNQLSVWSEYIS